MTPELRSLFPISERLVYLNHAAVSPLPLPTLQAVEGQLRDVHENGSLNYRSWLATRERTRQLLSGLLGAKPEQVAFTRNTSDALSTVANGMHWSNGDNIVTFRGEFPSNVYPWLRLRDAFGVEVRMCQERDGRVDLEELERLVDSRTRLIAISHVQFASGYRCDLERLGQLARKHDALLVVDMIQSLGVIPLDVEAELVDVAAGAGHKWLMTPEGVGYLYLSERARARIEPTLVGWTSVVEPEDYSNFDQEWKSGTLAWETGTAPTSLIYGLEASLKLLQQQGVSAIAAHLEQLTDYLCESLARKPYDVVSSRVTGEKSQIVCVRHRNGLSPMRLYGVLKDAGIVTAPRGDRLRISPHLYNSRQDVDRLLEALPS